jgi:dienelactone hydrolase
MLGDAMKTFLVWLLGVVLTASMMPALAGNPVFDPGRQGPYAVGFTTYTITDQSRPIVDPPVVNGKSWSYRPIPIYVWYPVDPARVTGVTSPAYYPMDPLFDVVEPASSDLFESHGLGAAYGGVPVSSKKPFPLVVFSPGWGGAAWNSVSTATRLASHGFVVAMLYHYGDGYFPWEPFDRIEVTAFNRMRDVSFALTDLLSKNGKAGDALFGAMRPDQVAAAGYSLGGYAAMVLGGAGEDNACPVFVGWFDGDPPPEVCGPTAPDPRIKAIVSFSPAAFILDWAELARVRVPTIIIGEEWNMLPPLPYGDQAEHARTHAAIQGQPSYRVDVFGTSHNSFCDMCAYLRLMHEDPEIFALKPISEATVELVCSGNELISTPSTVAMPIANKYAVAFLKTVLAREQGYQDMLTPGWALKRESLVEFFVTEKRNPNAVREEPGLGEYYLYFPHQSGSEQARGEKNPSVKSNLPLGAATD